MEKFPSFLVNTMKMADLPTSYQSWWNWYPIYTITATGSTCEHGASPSPTKTKQVLLVSIQKNIYIFMLYIMTSLINHHPIPFFFAQCTSKLLLEYMNIKVWCAFSSSSSVLKTPKAAPKRRLKSLECTPLAKLNKTSVTVFGGKRRTNCKMFRSELEWTSEELQWWKLYQHRPQIAKPNVCKNFWK